MDCACGPLRNHRHDDISDLYAETASSAGALARREVFVAKLSGRKEAWLDVWCYGMHEAPDVLLDITIRHPGAQRYAQKAAEQPGSAAEKAEGEKSDKYPAAAGRCVWPIAHETWGRLGHHAEAFLQMCASAATRREFRRGRLPGNNLARWRAQLDAALHRAVAMQLAVARSGMPGKKPHRSRRPPNAELEVSCPL